MPTEFLQDHWAPICAKHQTLIPTLPNIAQISKKKILRIEGQSQTSVTTNKNTYKSKIIVVAIGAANTFQLMG
jgi:thioredoxin reductase